MGGWGVPPRWKPAAASYPPLRPAEAQRLVGASGQLDPAPAGEGSRQRRCGHLPGIDELGGVGTVGQRKVIVDGLVVIHEVKDLLGGAAGCIGGRGIQVV